MGEPTIIKDLPGEAVEAYRREHGTLPSETQCGVCFNGGRVLVDGICEPCRQRRNAGEEQRRDGHSKLIAEGGEMKVVDPHPETASPPVVAELRIQLFADGNVNLTGPIQDRALILHMLTSASDISYEYQKELRVRAAIAAAPPPRKWSKAWWAQEFRRRAAAKQHAS